jgi:hypothetical protein
MNVIRQREDKRKALYMGFMSRDVSSVFSQSNENRNFSLGFTTRFFNFLAPKYCKQPEFKSIPWGDQLP